MKTYKIDNQDVLQEFFQNKTLYLKRDSKIIFKSNLIFDKLYIRSKKLKNCGFFCCINTTFNKNHRNLSIMKGIKLAKN